MEQPNTNGARRSSRTGEPTREERRRARQRRHAAAKERLSRIDVAEAQFFEAGTAIAAAEHDLEEVIAAAERRISDARARTADTIAGQRQRQARAAAAIRAEDCTLGEVAEILQLTPKQIRELISHAHSAPDDGNTPPRSTVTEPPTATVAGVMAEKPTDTDTSESGTAVDPTVGNDAGLAGAGIAASETGRVTTDTGWPSHLRSLSSPGVLPNRTDERP